MSAIFDFLNEDEAKEKPAELQLRDGARYVLNSGEVVQMKHAEPGTLAPFFSSSGFWYTVDGLLYGDESCPTARDHVSHEYGPPKVIENNVERIGSKPTNPKDSIGVKKAPQHLIPPAVMSDLGLAMLEGALKYGPYNWREAGVRASVYYDALKRHIAQWWEGETIDPDSGLTHIVKAMACLTILRDAQRCGVLEDDRPPAGVAPGWLQENNDQAKELIERLGQ